MHADREKINRLLRTARGQIDGVLKMIEDNRYCIDISNQIMATQAILRNVNREVLHSHLESCVEASIGAEDSKQKIQEIMQVLDKVMK